MTTKLSQTRVKGGDPSFDNLKDELQARILGGSGGSYSPPTTGIPLSDLSQHLRDLLTELDNSVKIPSTGVSKNELHPDAKAVYEKAISAYLKPTTGIPLSDLEETIRQRITEFADYYIYPSTGIPRVDLDGVVNASLDKADTAYQRPATGIPKADLSAELRTLLEEALGRYKKPTTGIPASDLEESYVTEKKYETAIEHMNNKALHITSHDDLLNIGDYTHREIDQKLLFQDDQLANIWRELMAARDDFSTVGNRINSLLGLNSFHSVLTKDEWALGKLKDLTINDEGFVGLTYQAEEPIINLYDISKGAVMSEDTRIGQLLFETDSSIYLGANPWQPVTERYNDVGVRIATNIYVDKTGTYEFATQFSGRVRLQVGSKLLYDTQGLYGQVDAYTRTNSVDLEAGRLYTLILEGWYTQEGDRVVTLLWKRPGANSFTEIQPKYFNNSGYMKTNGQYESEIIDLNDNNISKWIFDLDASENRAEQDIIVQLRTSHDGLDWLDWLEIEDSGEITRTPQRYVQVRIQLYQHHAFYSPVIRGYRIRYISSMNNEIMEELMTARESFLTVGHRFQNLEEIIQQLTKFIELQNRELFHPEFFASVRLASQELNTMMLLLREAERQVNYILLDNGVVDPLLNTNFIDKDLSDAFELTPAGLRSLESTKRLEGNNEWMNWERQGIDYSTGSLKLDYSDTDPFSTASTFSNWYLWSTRDTARLAGNYQSYIAQPFYTGDVTNVLTRLQLQTYDHYYTPYSTIMICETVEGTDLPNVANPLWLSTGMQYGVVNKTGLRIPVMPKTKYWIVIKREALQNSTGYSRWYLSYDNTSTNIRLRGSNPQADYMHLHYTASDANGDLIWSKDPYYYLSFIVGEATAYVAEGEATRLIDYHRPTKFTNAVVTRTLPTEPLVDITYQGSLDNIIWTDYVTNIDELPHSRFLRVKVNLRKSTTNSPTISRIDINSVLSHADIITHAIDARAIPTHAIYHAVADESITFFISRDNGVTWKELMEREFTQIDDIVAGQSVRFKIRFDGKVPTALVKEYGFLFTHYRDITQQNVTALYEEYIAEDMQTVFRLADRYVMGNHSLQVYLNGIRQSIQKDYDEVDRYTIQFKEPLIGGIDPDRVTFVVATGAYDQHDATMHHKIEEAQEQARALHDSHSKTHNYTEDGRLLSTTFNPEYFINSIEYEYENGRKVKETKTTKTYIEVIEYNYNDAGFLISESVTTSEVNH